MNNSIIEKNFIAWCNSINPNINANMFIYLYNDYYQNYLHSIETILKDTYNKIKLSTPNINFFQRGRIKSKHSFLIKTFTTMADNIINTFSANENQETYIETFLFFLKNSNPDKYNKMKTIIKYYSCKLNAVDCFNLIFNNLSPDEQNLFIAYLGKTEDLFAFKRVVKSIDFNVTDIFVDKNNDFFVIDSTNNKLKLTTAKKINPNKDIIIENNIKYAINNDRKKREIKY